MNTLEEIEECLKQLDDRDLDDRGFPQCLGLYTKWCNLWVEQNKHRLPVSYREFLEIKKWFDLNREYISVPVEGNSDIYYNGIQITGKQEIKSLIFNDEVDI